MIRKLSKRIRSFGGNKEKPDSSKWAPILILLGPHYSGKAEFVSTLNEPTTSVVLNEMDGLYQSVPLKDALIIWQDHASHEMKEKYKLVIKRLQSAKVKEQMVLALYFNRILTRKQLIASLNSIFEDDRTVVGYIVEAVKQLSSGGHRPQMTAGEVQILVSEAVPNAMNEALRRLKEACKHGSTQLVTWDDSNLTPTYAYKDLLAMASKYGRVVRFVRWGQELSIQPLSALIKANLIEYLSTGQYVDSRKLLTAFKMAATSAKNEADERMRHEDFARMAGFAMDPAGHVFPLNADLQQQQQQDVNASGGGGAVGTLERQRSGQTPTSASRPSTPSRQSSQRSQTPTSASTTATKATGNGSRPSTPSRQLLRANSGTPKRQNSGFFSFLSGKGNDDTTLTAEQASASSPVGKGPSVFDFSEIDEAYPWAAWTNDGVISSLHPLGSTAATAADFSSSGGRLNLATTSGEDGSDYGGSVKSYRSKSTAKGSPMPSSENRNKSKKMASGAQRQLSLELTAENLDSCLPTESDTLMDTVESAKRSSNGSGKRTPQKKKARPPSGESSVQLSINSNNNSSNAMGRARKSSAAAKTKKPFELLADDDPVDDGDYGYEDSTPLQQQQQQQQNGENHGLTVDTAVTSRAYSVDEEELMAARESAAARERTNMKAMRMIDDQVQLEQDGGNNQQQLRSHASFVRESSEVKKLLQLRKDPAALAEYELQLQRDREARERERELTQQQEKVKQREEQQLQQQQQQQQREEEQRQREEEAQKQEEARLAEEERKRAASRLQQSFGRNPNDLLNNRRRGSALRSLPATPSA